MTSPDPTEAPPETRRPRRDGQPRRRVVTLAVVTLAVVALVPTAWAGLRARTAARQGLDAARVGLELARDGDTERAAASFERAAERFGAARNHLDHPSAALGRVLPVVGTNLSAASTLARAGVELSTTAATLAADVDLDSITVEGGTVELDALAALRSPLHDAVKVLARASVDVERASRSAVLVPPVVDALDEARADLVDALDDAVTAAAGLDVAPGLLGGEGPRRYLVLFLNPAESRAAGGIVGNYALAEVADGSLELVEVGRDSDLNAGGEGPDAKVLRGPPDYLARYSRFNVQRFWQDITFSPDFPSVAQVAADLYIQSGGEPVDGVVAMDSSGVADLLELTGPVHLDALGGLLRPDDARDLLLAGQYERFPDIDERIAFLDEAVRVTFEALTEASLPGPDALADHLGPTVARGHLKVWSSRPDEQSFLERAGIADAMAPVRGDTLGLVTQNASANKIDTYLHRHLRYDAVWDPATGAVTGTATITLRNDAPEGLPDYVVGSKIDPPGDNHLFLSLYAAGGMEAVRLDGAPSAFESAAELGRLVYSRYLTVPHGAQRVVEIDLQTRLGPSPTYRLDLAAQPVVHPDEVEVTLRLADGTLVLDRAFTLREDTTLRAVVP